MNDLITWVVVWPLACILGRYYSAKTREIQGRPHLVEARRDRALFVEALIYVVVFVLILKDLNG